ncbi:Rv3212 family protein, partial [Pseudonocardia lacus]|uniref:Rv3212 family protein n=1 Tax=Pseudonocardia lacus TaxID=2835865 RepID=UPI001BDD55B3
RGDLVAAAVLVVLVVVAAAVLWGTGEVAGTTSTPAADAAPEPPPAARVPGGFTEAWRAPSGATPRPVVSRHAVVSADGSTVTGHDPRTGAAVWTYSRDVPLCTAAAGFEGADEGVGRVLALYREGPDWCSELTALRPDTGARAAAANPDTRPGARLLAAGSSVLGTGSDYLEVLRSDLVKTLEYGLVSAPAQPERQPRPGCRYGSTALISGRLGVVERCPGEVGDRLTVLSPDGPDGADKPSEEFSVALPGTGAVLVALTPERAAVSLPGPARLLVFDRQGAQVDAVGLDVPESELAQDPPGGVAAVRVDGQRSYWWTGSRTIALDAATLRPLWTVVGALGTALPYGGGLLVPVPDGLAEIDPVDGSSVRTLRVPRADPLGPVRLDAVGEVLVEQRGNELVALRPSG